MSLDPTTLNILQVLLILICLFLIPVGVGLTLVLFKSVFLLNGVSEFLTIAKYELGPVMRDLRSTAQHVEVVTDRMASGVTQLEEGLETVKTMTSPMVSKGLDRTKLVAKGLSAVASRLGKFLGLPS